LKVKETLEASKLVALFPAWLVILLCVSTQLDRLTSEFVAGKMESAMV
jgi:hypothetical protein